MTQAHRIYNFNPGPAMLPEPVLISVQEELLDYRGSGMSVMEISHRSPLFDEILEQTILRTRRLLGLDDRFHVLFLTGGASMQFAMIPMNFLPVGKTADYINTGTWSTKAIEQAQIQKKAIRLAGSSEDAGFSYIPAALNFDGTAAYVHLTSNNTIKGTQWHTFPDTGSVPLVCDMCSDMFSRPVPTERFGMIYAGAQKNIGPAGVTLVILRDDMLSLIPEGLPTLLDYRTYISKNSMYNTPPVFAIYVMEKVLEWLETEIGGLAKMAEKNAVKADLLYNRIDASEFYRGTAEKMSRSLMNATFRLPTPELEKEFIVSAKSEGLGGLGGHKSVGGCRASIYNAMPLAGVKALTDFMVHFEKTRG